MTLGPVHPIPRCILRAGYPAIPVRLCGRRSPGAEETAHYCLRPVRHASLMHQCGCDHRWADDDTWVNHIFAEPARTA